MKLMLVFGGCSSEHEVSLDSASYVYDAIKDKYELVKVYIDKKGCWYVYEGENIRTCYCDGSNLKRVNLKLDSNNPGLVCANEQKEIKVDKALIIMHGKYGEDGHIQGMLEMLNIEVCGCSMISSALGFDKDLAKRLVMAKGVKSARYVCLRNGEVCLTQQLRYPVFVKPNKQGSSFGISKVHNEDELLRAIELAYEYDDEVIVEETVVGNEIGCGIIGNQEIMISEVDELVIPNAFFSYEEKYHDNEVVVNLPADFDEQLIAEIKNTAKTIYQLLKCKGFARIDMFITKDRQIYFNEINTIPGLTSHSRFPMMFKAQGIGFDELIERMIENGDK